MTIISYRHKPAFLKPNKIKISFSEKGGYSLKSNNPLPLSNPLFYLRYSILFIFFFFLLYLFISYQSSILGHKIVKTEKTLADLKIENQNLKANLSNVRSLKNLEEVAVGRGLGIENKPIYIKIDSVKVASFY